MSCASCAMLGVVATWPRQRQHGSTVVSALEAAYRDIRAEHPELPDAVIITGSGLSGYGLTWGHFARDAWHDAVIQGRRPELFIGGERLATGAELTMQTLLHEATHAIAYARDIKDTSRGHRYHNRKFVAIAEELGLAYTHESPDSVIGFSAVTLTRQGLSHWHESIDRIRDAVSLNRGDPTALFGTSGGTLTGLTGGGHGAPIRRPKGTGGTSYIKAQCACPRTIRVARSVLNLGDITCGVCGEQFV